MPTRANPPIAKTVPFEFQHLNTTYSDPYAWLQNIQDPEVMAYIDAENAYADRALAHTTALQQQLYDEMRGRIPEDEISVPERRGNYYYYSRFEAGKQYRIFCRKEASLDAPEQILLDENLLAEGKDYCRVGIFTPSPDQKLLAYAVDFSGSWVFDLFVKDMQTGEVLLGPIAQTAYSLAWASNSRTLFYIEFDHAHRAYRLYRSNVDTPQAQAALLYEEKDESFRVDIRRSRSGAYLFMALESFSTSEMHFLAADQPLGHFQVVQPREHGHEYSIEHQGGRFLILSNAGAENFAMLETPVNQPSRENWHVLIAHNPDILLEQVFPFQDYLVLFERAQGLPRLRVSGPDGLIDAYQVEFPEEVYAIYPQDNPEYHTDQFRFKYTSLVTPMSTIDYGMDARTWDVKQRQEIPSGYDPQRYETHRIFAASAGGAQVPISLIHRKGMVFDGSNPLLMYGYGSYGINTEVSFQSARLSLLDRGFVFALAHIRGGSEMGRAWYEHGRLQHKMNTFLDFIACAERLIAVGYTSKDKLAIMGGSAGGLLVSAVANLRPDLFKVVVALVPFTNVITAILDPNLPLTVVEYEQWGNHNDPQAFDYMLSYSPYENVSAIAYPHIYTKTGIQDLQVPYWDPLKWVAKLRAVKTDNNRLALRILKGAGHGGSSGRYDHLREDAEMYAFILDSLGFAA
jgi:oligopeptidase B